jgi:hypothetical protein
MKPKKLLSVMAILVLLLALLPTTVFAGGPANKATGSGMWTNGQGYTFTADFNAHEAYNGRPAKGWLVQTRVDGGGSFAVVVDQVDVHPNYACFGGVTTEATGAYADRLNKYRWTMVIDGGEGVDSGGDYLQGRWGSRPGYCNTGTSTNYPFSGGNVQIHYEQ